MVLYLSSVIISTVNCEIKPGEKYISIGRKYYVIVYIAKKMLTSKKGKILMSATHTKCISSYNSVQ